MSKNAPGLRRQRRKDGRTIAYWIAADITRRASDYPLKTMRLHGDDEEIAACCRVLTAELHLWLAGQAETAAAFTGTVASLIDNYQSDADSPYRAVKGNTRRHYDQVLVVVGAAVGARRVDALTRKDFVRWHRGFRFPEGEDGPERRRRAHNCMKLVRIVMNYGASMRYAGCADAAMVLHRMRFALPAARAMRLSYEQAAAVVEAALAAGRPSIALAQALQFELSLRQRDVIGEWTPVARADESGIVYHGQRWSGGVLWSDLAPDMVLSKRTTKTAALGEWSLRLHPLAMRALTAFDGPRAGPMIVSETTGYPYRPDDFRFKWRRLARAAGVPDDVWNMDSRAGGISEGADAGADVEDLRRHATHTSTQMTARYIRGTRPATERVATLRTARRGTSGEQASE